MIKKPRTERGPAAGSSSAKKAKAASEAESAAASKITVTLDPKLLKCSVCCSALCPPVFQCSSGHTTCSDCCEDLEYDCSLCGKPNDTRCRAVEQIICGMTVACSFREHGCTDMIPFTEKLFHEESCPHAPCYCPIAGCPLRPPVPARPHQPAAPYCPAHQCHGRHLVPPAHARRGAGPLRVPRQQQGDVPAGGRPERAVGARAVGDPPRERAVQGGRFQVQDPGVHADGHPLSVRRDAERGAADQGVPAGRVAVRLRRHVVSPGLSGVHRAEEMSLISMPFSLSKLPSGNRDCIFCLLCSCQQCPSSGYWYCLI